VIVRFVDVGVLVDHHCLEVIVRFVDVGGLVYYHCLEVIAVMVNKYTNINKLNNHL
jgi:hypothetical protein